MPRNIPEPFASIARACLRPQPSLRCSLGEVRSKLAGEQLGARAERETGHQQNSMAPAAADWASTTRTAAPRRRMRVAILSAAVVVAIFFGALELRPHRQANPNSAAAPPQVSSAAAPPDRTLVASIPKPRPERRTSGGSPSSDEAPDEVVPTASEESGIVKQVLPRVLPAAQASIHGKVDVTVRVTAASSGEVSSAELESPGPSRYFARISQEAAQQWRFDPAATGSARTWLLHFAFRQSGVTVVPSRTGR
jgi:TonB family protein